MIIKKLLINFYKKKLKKKNPNHILIKITLNL